MAPLLLPYGKALVEIAIASQGVLGRDGEGEGDDGEDEEEEQGEASVFPLSCQFLFVLAGGELLSLLLDVM